MHFSRSRLFSLSMVTLAASFIAREASAVQPVSDCSKWVAVVQWGGPMFYVGTATLKQGSTTIDTSVREALLSAAGQIMPGGSWNVSPSPGSYQAMLDSKVYVGATHALSQSERDAWPPGQVQSTSGSSATFSCGTNPPAITSTPGTHARMGEAYNYQIQVSYSGNTSALRYYFVGGPEHMSVGELTGLVQLTAQTSDLGLRPVILRVNGENGLFTIQSFILNVYANTAPTASDDEFSTNENTPLSANVLTNDSDPNGDPLTAVLISGPNHGSANLASNGNLDYTPTTSYFGSDSLTYRASDGLATSAIATVQITVHQVAHAPVANNDAYRVGENLPRTLEPGPLSNDVDLDEDSLSLIVTALPAHGTLDVDDNIPYYSPDPGYSGLDSFRYFARDPGGLESDEAEVLLTIFGTDDPPSCADRDYEIDEDQLLEVSAVMGLASAGTDPEGDAIIIFPLTLPEHGVLTVALDGAFTYLPGANENGAATFEFLCHDGQTFADEPSLATITIHPVNDAPIANAGADRTIAFGDLVTLLGEGSDVEAQPVTFAWSITGRPTGSTVTLTNPQSRTPSFVPDQLGSYVVQLTVTDASNATGTDSVLIEAANLNRPPVITSTPVLNAKAGHSYSYQVEATDEGELTYALDTAPTGMSISGSHLISWTPSESDIGPHPVTVLVHDVPGLEASQSFTVTVSPRHAPVAVDDSYSVRAGETLHVPAPGLLTNDSDADGDPLTAAIVTPPRLGAFSANSNGSFDYTFTIAPPGPISVTEKFHAVQGLDVMSTPMVAPLTDDNDDGVINSNDVPAIVFATMPNGPSFGGAIKAISGADGHELFTAGGPDQIMALSQLAIGDIDGDGFVEIIAEQRNATHLVAYEHTGALKWVSQQHTIPGVFGGDGITIANLDGVGLPEIIVGAQVYDAAGNFLADGASLGGTQGFNTYPTLSVAADVDLDGQLELIAGPSAYHLANGHLTLVWHRADRSEGFVGIGNFDDDPYAEIVVISAGSVYMLNHDGTNVAGWNPPSHGPVSFPRAGSGGAPTIADVDGDGIPEIGVASSTGYMVFERDGSVRWSVATQDGSSGITGSTTFDFNLDGQMEIVYRDELQLRIYRGTDGSVLFSTPMPSGTFTEYPVVADVDRDGHADLIVAADTTVGGSNLLRGVHVYTDLNNAWAPTRSIWNQHSYHVTNVEDNGAIPAHETSNWLTPGLNSFRTNTFMRESDRTDLFTYRATDGAQLSNLATATLHLLPLNSTPTFVSSPPTTALIGVTYTYQILVSDPDAGDTLTLQLITAPNGMSLLSSPDRLVWNAATPDLGDHAVVLKVSDAQGSFSLQNFSVHVRTRLPETVPNAVGLDLSAAVAAVQAAGLVNANSSAYSLTVAPGHVISQSPAGGTAALEADVVNLSISLGPAPAIIPDVSERSTAEASAILSLAGFVLGDVSQAPHPTIEEGLIATQTPAAGASSFEGTVVDVVVSTGVRVPDVVSLFENDARAAILDMGLSIGTVTYETGPNPAGTVMSLSPAALTPATPGQAVSMVVSLGTDTVAVPQLVGLLESAARDALAANELAVGEISFEASTTIPSDVVIAAVPAEGSFVAIGSSVDLIVSLGPSPVTVPDLSGLAVNDAIDALIEAGLGSFVRGEASATVPIDHLVRTDPPAGSVVVEGTEIYLLVSVGPTAATVPDVIGHSESVASSEIAAANLSASTTSVHNNSVAAGLVITQTPASGAVVAQNSSVEIVVSLGPSSVTVPDVVGLSMSAARASIEAAELVANFDFDASVTVPIDAVISQAPLGGTTINAGSGVDVLVSSGPNPTAVPRVIGFAQAQAQTRLTQAGFTVGTISHEPSTTMPSGQVASQTPGSGALRPAGAAIDLVVSTGRSMSTVPRVVGLSQPVARTDIEAAQLTVGAVTFEYSVETAGLIIRQSPIAGCSRPAGASVDLVVSIGPAPDTTPPRISMTITPEHASSGETITIEIAVAGEVLPVTIALSVDGTSVPVNSSGVATFTRMLPGMYEAVATVTDASGNESEETQHFSIEDLSDTTPPIALITSPGDGDSVTMPVAITGTADDANFFAYTLALRKGADGDFVTIQESTSPVTGTLGTLDPTLLENGLYTLRLEAIDINGQVAIDDVLVQIEGGMKIGVFSLCFNDLSIPVSGIPIVVARCYDSRVKTKEDFGIGWKLQVAAGKYEHNRTPGEGWEFDAQSPTFDPFFIPCISGHRELRLHRTEIRLNQREFYTFVPRMTNIGRIGAGCVADVVFEQVGGWGPPATLDVLGNSTIVHQFGTGVVRDDLTLEVFNPRFVQLHTYDGRTIDFERGHGVVRLEDRSANQLFIDETGILHSSGTAIAFDRDELGRIRTITDPRGEQLHYLYDENGDLTQFTDQADNTTRFTYNGDHGILDIIDPLGVRATRYEYDLSGRLAATIDPSGNRFAFEHDLASRRETITDRLNYTRYIDYNERGNVVLETYPGSPTVTVQRTFDSRDNVLTQTNELQQTTTWTYDANNNRVSETNPLGETRSWTYDSQGSLLTRSDARESTTSYVYGSVRQPVTITDGDGHETTFVYDARGNATRECDARGLCIRGAYDLAGRLTRRTDRRGFSVERTYDANGKLHTETTTRATAQGIETLTTTHVRDERGLEIEIDRPDGSSVLKEYDARGLLARSLDARGRATSFEYDDIGRCVLTLYPDRTTETTTYDAEGRRVLQTDREGRTRTFDYNARGRLLQTTYDGAVVHYAYDAAGRLTGITDPRGNTTTRVLDAAGRVVELRNALLQSTFYTYNGSGNVRTIRDAKGRTSTNTYDLRSLLVRVDRPDGTFETMDYDEIGDVTEKIDAQGRATHLAYDGEGNLISVTNPANETWTFGYDELGNLITQTDPLEHTTRLERDPMGRETSRRFAIGPAQGRAYDLGGNLTRRTSSSGAITDYTYDDNNRLLTRTDADGTINTAYSATGRRLVAADARGATVYAYDGSNRLASVTDASGRSLVYSYDLSGNLTTRIANTGAESWSDVYSYDVLDRITSVTANGESFALSYDATGQLASIAYPNGLTTSYSHDALDRVSAIVVRDSEDAVKASWTYARSATGNITSVLEGDGTLTELEYDLADRVTLERVRANGVTRSLREFFYDDAGNRTETDFTPAGESTEVQACTLDERDRLLTQGSSSFTWDDDGRLLTRSGPGSYAATWSAQDRLVRIDRGDGSFAEHAYDIDGVRVRETETSASGASDVADLLVDTRDALSHVVAEIDPSNGLSRARYVRAKNLLLAVARGGETHYLHQDHLGSIRALSDESGDFSDRYRYAPFGELTEHEGSDPNRYLFAGEPFDSKTQLSYHRARWLDPSIGRFLSIDPWRGDPAQPATLHRYFYAANNPLLFVDPTGRTFDIQGQMTALAAQATLIIARAQSGITFLTAAGLSRMEALARLGAASQDLMEEALEDLIETVGATLEPNVQVSQNKIDFLVKLGDRAAFIEGKFQIPGRGSEAMGRLTDQMEAALADPRVADGVGEVIMWSLKPATGEQLVDLAEALGANADRIRLVFGIQEMQIVFSDLFGGG